MPSNCPICEQAISATSQHCTVCGFPTALAFEGLRSIEPVPAAPNGDPGAPAGPRRPARAASPQAELTNRISRDLRGKMEIVRELGRSLPDATSELCQAALSEAEGREGEALETLRGAQARLERELDELLDRRYGSLIARRDALLQQGIRLALGPELDRIAEELQATHREEATARLLEAERRLDQLESDWKGLQGLLGQIESLRNEATELGLPLGEISGEIEQIRDRLAQPRLTEETLDELAQDAAQALMLLHEAIPSSLEEELGRHAQALDRYPDEHVPSAVARRLHGEASRHLKKGRLPEAIQSVRELRAQITMLRQAAELSPPPPSPRASEGEESEGETLDRLLKKARALAGRVRTLPPESETARDAAMEIRSATEALRARDLATADEILARLMRLLSGAETGE